MLELTQIIINIINEKVVKSLIFCNNFCVCLKNERKNSEPISLKRTPDNAFWVGDVEGGNWYAVESVHDHKNNAYLKVYNN